jgi:hypothetical protein
MALTFAALLVLVFLGFPFYWGAFGHPGFIMPVSWAVVVAVVVNLRHWRHVDRGHLLSFVLTLVVSLAACSAVFELGRILSR